MWEDPKKKRVGPKPENRQWALDWAGALGLPLTPTHEHTAEHETRQGHPMRVTLIRKPSVSLNLGTPDGDIR